MPGDAPAARVSEIALLRRERDIAIAVAAQALADKSGMPVDALTVATSIRDRARRELELLISSPSEATPN